MSIIFNNLNHPHTKTLVKMCGFTQVKDIEFAIELNINAIGLVFYKQSPRYVDITLAEKLTQIIPKHIQIVGLFVNEDINIIKNICQKIRIDLVQLHGDENTNYCNKFIHTLKLPYIKAIGINHTLNINRLKKDYISSQGLLLDSKTLEYGGSGTSFNWDLINKQEWLNRDKPLILSGGINLKNMSKALCLQPYAIDFSSCIEISKGIKDHQKMQEIINQISGDKLKAYE